MEMKMKLIPAALLAAGLFSSNAFAADCSAIAEWDNNTVYTGGKQVQQDGQAYKAAWWTKGDSPASNAGEWAVWGLPEMCDGGSRFFFKQ